LRAKVEVSVYSTNSRVSVNHCTTRQNTNKSSLEEPTKIKDE
jgi:hypothetical protein